MPDHLHGPYPPHETEESPERGSARPPSRPMLRQATMALLSSKLRNTSVGQRSSAAAVSPHQCPNQILSRRTDALAVGGRLVGAYASSQIEPHVPSCMTSTRPQCDSSASGPVSLYESVPTSCWIRAPCAARSAGAPAAANIAFSIASASGGGDPLGSPANSSSAAAHIAAARVPPSTILRRRLGSFGWPAAPPRGTTTSIGDSAEY